MLAQRPHERRAEHLEERAVIIKNVAVLEQAAGPAPDDVEVLRLVGIHPIDECIEEVQSQQPCHGEPGRPRLGDAEHLGLQAGGLLRRAGGISIDDG